MSIGLSLATSVGYLLAFFFGYLKGKERSEWKLENLRRLIRRLPYYERDPALLAIRNYLCDETQPAEKK